MAGYRAVLKRQVLGGFATVHLPNKDFGEINPNFADEFDDLGPVWNLIDAEGNSHHVAFNSSATLPRLTNGWTELRQFYQFEGMKLIMFSYVGQSRFVITLGNTIMHTDDIPSYHSRSTRLHNKKSFFFDITLTPLQMEFNSELVLPPDFNDFLWNGDFDYLYLSNDNGQIFRTTIDYQASDSLETKLINGWDDFCTSSGYQAGDVLRFKFFYGKLSNFVHVFINNA